MNSFAEDVLKGLSANPRYLPSMYFYDEAGDRLFKEITKLEEYYLTRCEEEILNNQKEKMLQCFSPDGAGFNLIELGPGDGLKSRILLEYLKKYQVDFEYFPIDISDNVLSLLEKNLSRKLPGLKIHSMNMDYFKALDELHRFTHKPSIVLFLGSNIGNFKHQESVNFLKALHEKIDDDDRLLIGMDLKKDAKLILAAYDDKKGITRDFNLNYLQRINRELRGEFLPEHFFHKAVYDQESGEAKSFLVSKCKHEVYIGALDQTFVFDKNEAIFMEVSKKFDGYSIEQLAAETGFRVEQYFYDNSRYFTNVIWRKV